MLHMWTQGEENIKKKRIRKPYRTCPECGKPCWGVRGCAECVGQYNKYRPKPRIGGNR